MLILHFHCQGKGGILNSTSSAIKWKTSISKLEDCTPWCRWH
jgi:hypothetical protein